MALTGCCGCYDLRRGSLAIGIVHLVFAVLGLLAAIVVLAASESLLRQPMVDMKMSNEWINWAMALARGISITGLCFALVMVCVSAALIRGVMTSNACLMLIWIIIYGILFVLMTIGHFIGFIGACVSGYAGPIVSSLVGLLIDALVWYWFAVVVQHYHNVRDEEAAIKMNRVRPAMMG